MWKHVPRIPLSEARPEKKGAARSGSQKNKMCCVASVLLISLPVSGKECAKRLGVFSELLHDCLGQLRLGKRNCGTQDVSR